MPPPSRQTELRREYSGRALREADVAADPYTQFGLWFAEAVEAAVREPTAVVVATAHPELGLRARCVLLKEWDERGFVFATNFASRKGVDLAADPRVGLVFPWLELHRQVHISGVAERAEEAVSDRIFAARPRGAQLAAWASAQSQVLGSRDELLARVAALDAAHPGEVARPAGWGAYRVRPDEVELWQGQPDRLHDRLRYRRTTEGWLLERLAP